MRYPVLGLIILLAVGGLAAVAGASPQPTPVCGPCGGGLTAVTYEAEELRGLSVTESTATVQVHEDGSATWQVTNHVANQTAIEYLDRHPGEVDRLVRDALEGGAIDGPFRNVSATLNGSTISIQYTDPDAVQEQPGGVGIVDYFHSDGYDSWAVLTADRLTISAPEGTTITNQPAGARIDGRNATWTGNSTVPLYEAPQVEQDAYVAFATEGPTTGVATWLAIALATAPIVIDVFASVYFPSLLVVTVLAFGVVTSESFVRRSRYLSDQRSVARGVAILGLLGVASIAGGAVLSRLVGVRWPLEVGLLYLTMGAVTLWRGPAIRLREVVLAGGTAIFIIALGSLMFSGGIKSTQSDILIQNVSEAIRLLPLVSMVVLGALSTGENSRQTWLGILSVVAAAFIAELTVVWPTQRPFGLILILLLFGVIALCALGFPLFLLGRVLERESALDETPR